MPRKKYGAKPKNFPGRLNARRIGALGRIEQQLASNEKRNSGWAYPLTADEQRRLMRQADTLALRIRPEAELLAIRTKKDRSGTGRLTRKGA